MTDLSDKARTIPQIVKQLQCRHLWHICKECMAPCEFEGTDDFEGKWVLLSEAQQMLKEYDKLAFERTQKLINKYNDDLLALKQKLRAILTEKYPSTMNPLAVCNMRLSSIAGVLG